MSFGGVNFARSGRRNIENRSTCFWAQLGLENEEAANLLLNEGRQVIMNRCIKIELAKMADAE